MIEANLSIAFWEQGMAEYPAAIVGSLGGLLIEESFVLHLFGDLQVLQKISLLCPVLA